MSKTHSPLGYPGGKSRALGQILPRIPEFAEYREPFFGGGSVGLRLSSMYPDRGYWFNDLYYDLYCFWRSVRDEPECLVESVELYLNQCENGRDLYDLVQPLVVSELDRVSRAARYFILNRITFGGGGEVKGYSERNYVKRMNTSAIERIVTTSKGLPIRLSVSNLDYERLLQQDGTDVFLFLDPPYMSNSKSRLYGTDGKLHSAFDFQRLSDALRKCPHKWLMTIDNCDKVVDLFQWARIEEWHHHYTLGTPLNGSAKTGRELFIANY